RSVGRGNCGAGTRPDVHGDHGARLFASLEERVPVATPDTGEIQPGRELAEGDSRHTPRGIAPHLLGRRYDVPDGNEAQGDQASAAAGAPFVHHEVVVGLDTQHGQVTV